VARPGKNFLSVVTVVCFADGKWEEMEFRTTYDTEDVDDEIYDETESAKNDCDVQLHAAIKRYGKVAMHTFETEVNGPYEEE
jgi:hypothetical protein